MLEIIYDTETLKHHYGSPILAYAKKGNKTYVLGHYKKMQDAESLAPRAVETMSKSPNSSFSIFLNS